MAPTNPDGKRDGFHFRQWFADVTGGWFGAGKYVVPAGTNADPKKLAIPPSLLLAKRMVSDKYKGPLYRSRMEEAKRKNMVWQSDLRPLVEEALRSMFHPQNYARMKLFPSLWTNQMRRLVNDLSILYESPAIRYIEEEEQKQTQGSNPDDAAKSTEKFGAKPKPTEPEPAAVDEKEEPKPDEETDPDKTPAFPPKKQELEDGVEPEGDADATAPDETNPIGTGDIDIDGLADVLDLEGATGTDAESPLDKVLKLVDLDTYLDLVEHMVRFHDAVWLRPIVRYEGTIDEQIIEGDPESGVVQKGDPSKAKLHFIVYDPSNACVVEDPTNPSEALAWYYWGEELQENGTLANRVHFWTKDNYWKLDEDWKPLTADVNPYGRIPVVKFLHELPTPGCYYVNGQGKDLYEATIELCVLRTIQNTRYRDAGFKQLAIVGADTEDIDADQVMGGPTPLYIPAGEGAGATVLDMQANLQEMTDTLESRQIELAAKFGVSSNEYKSENTPQSGFAKKLDRDKVLKENRRIRKFFVESEKDLYQLLAIILKIHPIADLDPLDGTKEFTVDFGEPKFEENPEEQAKIDAQEIKMFKTSIVDVLKRENPDLNEVELIRLAYRNKRINEAFVTSEQMRLVDLLAAPEGGGGGFGGGGGGFGGGGDKPEPPAGKPGAKPPPFGAKGKAVPPKGKAPPFGAKK